MRGRTVGGLPGVFVLIDFVEVDRILIVGVGVDIKLQTARFVVVRADGITHGGLYKLSTVPWLNLGGHKERKHNFSIVLFR